MKTIIRHSILLTLLLSFQVLLAQDVAIQLGNNNIAKNQYFTITAVAKGENITEISQFPEIPNFRHAGTSSSSSTNIINGRMSSEHKYIHNYLPTKEGTFKLNSFQMKINGKVVQSNGTTITVGKEIQQQQHDPFADFFGRSRNQQPREFVDVQDDAFFAISSDKNSIYEGEGVTLSAAFYVSLKNRAPLDFVELNEQITALDKVLKQENSWQEQTRITQIKDELVEINGEQYKKFLFYQSTFYPLSSGIVKVPQFGFKMLKYKVAKQQSFFGNNHQRDFKIYYSKPKNIQVKPLPPHPLKDVVSVGNFKLKEGINTDKFETGKSFNYQFKIVGVGNIAAIKPPNQNEEGILEIYPPNEHQNINRDNGLVTGNKLFDYYVIPKEAGEIKFSDYFQWIYFNTQKEQYDTLKPAISIKIIGESQKDSEIMSNDLGSFYDRISNESESLFSIKTNNFLYFWIEIIVGSIALSAIVLFFMKRR